MFKRQLKTANLSLHYDLHNDFMACFENGFKIDI